MKFKKYLNYNFSTVLAVLFLFLWFVPPTQASCPALPADSVTSSISIPATGNYTIWSRLMAPDSVTNSYYLEVDGSACGIVVGDSVIPANTWTWIDYSGGNSANKIVLPLTAGVHTVRLGVKESGLKLDRLIFGLSSSACVPMGTGDNCLVEPTPTPTVLPKSYTIWQSSAIPATPKEADPQPVEVGVKFRSDIDGFISALRFYKGLTNTGRHVGNLWTSDGTKLATANFTNETASGWQQVNFASPVKITANTTYVASYFAPNGNYAGDSSYFSDKGADNAPLHALTDGTDGGNGVYLYGGGFPVNTYQSTNYWVDVVFASQPTSLMTTPTLTPPSLSPTFTPTPQPITLDTTSPSITIIVPSNGSVISKGAKLAIAANASDNIKVLKVEFYVNGVLKCTDNTVFYSCPWHVPNKRRATYSISAKAYDAAGNTAQSSVTVRSNN